MMKVLTNLFRALAILMILVVVLINSSQLLEISPVVSAVLSYLTCLFVELAMLFQTIKNREGNSCRQNFGYKLIFVSLLLISSTVLCFVELLKIF